MGLMVLASELFMMMINVCAAEVVGRGGGEGGVQAFASVLCVYMMMMNGGLPLHALPVSAACKHREMIWADTLSCSLMQLYIQSTK